MTEDCKKELAEFKIDRGTNINKNVPLGVSLTHTKTSCSSLNWQCQRPKTSLVRYNVAFRPTGLVMR